MTTPTIQRVLVAVKPMQAGLPLAAHHARMLAEQFGAELTLFSSIYDSAVAARVVGERQGAVEARDGMLEAERINLERLAELLREWGVTVRTEVRWHLPAHEAIVEAVHASKADLLVVGPHEPKLGLHTRLTDTDWQLMRLCPCPLLIVKDPEFQAYGTVLAAVDPLSDHAEPEGANQGVLNAASLFAKALGGELWLANAYPDPAEYSWVSAVEVMPGVFYGAENIPAIHRQAAQELGERYGVGIDHIVLRPGDPRDVVTEATKELGAQLVVLGALKRGRFEQAVLGSTAEYVVAESQCDVLLVKPGWPAG